MRMPTRSRRVDPGQPSNPGDAVSGGFNALVEVLQASMAAQGVPFATQNRLLARLAPMHREIVNVH